MLKKGGTGRTGQVKKGSFFGRTINVDNQKLNRGSLVDFINSIFDALREIEGRLDKGSCLFGGATDEAILNAVEKIKNMNQLVDVLKKIDTRKSVHKMNTNNPYDIRREGEVKGYL